MRRLGTVLVTSVFVVAIGAALAGCKQGEGDYCQIDRDCSDGLICVRATNTCQVVGSSSGVDAAPTVDARVIDAAPMVDARVIDAAPAVDASPDAP